MRVCIVTPSEEFSASAGVRIRYDRLAAAARFIGHEIVLQPMAEFKSRGDFVHDTYIFAKTYSPIAPVLAQRMRQADKRVGLDIFDDYFTQTSDQRLLRYRLWFAAMAEVSQFYLCSTPRLAAAITPLTRGKPLEVIGDPSDVLDPPLLDYLLAAKCARRKSDGVIRVLWFGIGDNPYFPVGLRDLSAYGHLLRAFNDAGARAELRILTNTRALTAEGLGSLRRLPLVYTIEEWTPDREADELRTADLCFLPVNAQGFSRVKSLNRAVTALTAGCQVLSAGFPLYDELGPFVYRSAPELRDDLLRGQPALRSETVGDLVNVLNSLASPYTGAGSLFQFLSRIHLPRDQFGAGKTEPVMDDTSWPPSPVFAADLAVIHGAQPEGRLHKLVQRFNGLTVKGPLCREEWNCQIRFDVTDRGRLRVLVEQETAKLLDKEYRRRLVPFGAVKDMIFEEVQLDATPLAPHVTGWPLVQPNSLIRLYALSPRLETSLMSICRTIMPGVRFILNEKLAAVPAAMRLAS